MANRNFNRRQALEKEVKDLYLTVTFAAAGAPTITSGVGFASIVRNSAGDYTITLQDQYVSLKVVDGTFLAAAPQDLDIQVKAQDVSGAKTVEIVTLTGATPTDPASGQTLLLKVELKNTTVI